MAPLTVTGMGDDVPRFPPPPIWGTGVGGGGQECWPRTGLSPTGSAGQMDALCRGVRADALIWADVLAQQPPLPRATWRNATKRMGKRRRKETPSSSLATPACLLHKGWFKGSIIGMSRGRGGQAHRISPAFPRDGAISQSS